MNLGDSINFIYPTSFYFTSSEILRSGRLQEVSGHLMVTGSVFVSSIYNFFFNILSIYNFVLKILHLSPLILQGKCSPAASEEPMDIGPLSFSGRTAEEISSEWALRVFSLGYSNP